MAKWMKKPVVIDAVKFSGDTKCLSELSTLGLEPVNVSFANPDDPVIIIETLEGNMIGKIGDYIIKGVSGEFYPCKPEIFAATYELAEPTDWPGWVKTGGADCEGN